MHGAPIKHIQHEPENHGDDQRKNGCAAPRRRQAVQLRGTSILRDALIVNLRRRPAPGDGHSQIIEDLLGGEAGARKHDGHAGAGVGARADEVGAAEAARARPGAERQHVQEAVAQAQDGALVQVELGLPRVGVVDLLVHDGLLAHG